MLKYEIDKLKSKLAASFTKSTDINAKQIVNDAKLTVMYRINARWRTKKYQEKSYVKKKKNVT